MGTDTLIQIKTIRKSDLAQLQGIATDDPKFGHYRVAGWVDGTGSGLFGAAGGAVIMHDDATQDTRWCDLWNYCVAQNGDAGLQGIREVTDEFRRTRPQLFMR